jgi:hypothetical protein
MRGKYMMRLLFVLCALLAFNTAGASARFNGGGVHINGQGLPLPWPFPWAKDCPVHWESLEGTYELASSQNFEAIKLNVTFINKFMTRLVRVTRLDRSGNILADGLAIVHEGQRSIRVKLQPLESETPMTTASIKFYYSNRELSCAQSDLVPILTLVTPGSNSSQKVDYRLIRMGGRG